MYNNLINRRVVITIKRTKVKTDINEVLEVEQEIDLKIKEELSRLISLGIEAGEIRTDISKEIIDGIVKK